MIKWNSNFNIPDSTVQLGEAYVRVQEFKNINNTSVVHIQITDDTGIVIVKDYTQNFERAFVNEDEIYQELIKGFENSVII